MHPAHSSTLNGVLSALLACALYGGLASHRSISIDHRRLGNVQTIWGGGLFLFVLRLGHSSNYPQNFSSDLIPSTNLRCLFVSLVAIAFFVAANTLFFAVNLRSLLLPILADDSDTERLADTTPSSCRVSGGSDWHQGGLYIITRRPHGQPRLFPKKFLGWWFSLFLLVAGV